MNYAHCLQWNTRHPDIRKTGTRTQAVTCAKYPSIELNVESRGRFLVLFKKEMDGGL